MIPVVKTWIVTTDDGAQYEVMAPTRVLAVLNFRREAPLGGNQVGRRSAQASMLQRDLRNGCSPPTLKSLFVLGGRSQD